MRPLYWLTITHRFHTISTSWMDIEPQPQRFKKTYTPNKVPPTCAALYKKIVLVKIHIYGKNHKQTDWETTMYSLVNMISLDWDFQWPSTSLWVDTIWNIWVAYTSHSISYLCTRLPTKIVVHTVNNIITTVENLFCLSLRMRERKRERVRVWPCHGSPKTVYNRKKRRNKHRSNDAG